MYNPEIEAASREELRKIQYKALIKSLHRVYDNVPLYKQRFDEWGVKPDDIKSVDDLSKLPFTYKQDLRDCYPYALFAVPMEEVVRIHASSGTTGKQTVVGYTKNDLDMWSVCVARALSAAGATKRDFVHVSYGYGLFTGGLGIHDGAQLLGAITIPASVGNTDRQLQIFQDFGSSILCCTPSYALYLGETIAEKKIPLENLKLKAGIFGAEPWTENMRREIETRLGIKAYDIYGLSEIVGPGVSYECECQAGMHINEDNFIPEIIDPETGKVLPYGERGELVFTCVTKEALPLIRYRTRDISRLIPDKCACGRTFLRMEKPCGRSDDMLIIRGVNVFPSQIESVLLTIKEVLPHYMLIVDRANNLDTLEVKVEINEEILTSSDAVRHIEDISLKIKHKIDSTLGISAKITLVEPNSIPRSQGKAQRVIDNRKLN
ncbi:MAG: phenylacetate--CoA ligase [Eubacteriales bacterium]|nr:phenylacetate--CoA ligase [Eubacteriales bacterium]MDD4474515.1 phenylacetate--CoA ligase [Eubacteriales bacterium]